MSPLLSIPQLAELLGTSERHVRNLVYLRTIPYVKVGHFVRFRPEAIDAWIESNAERPSP